MRIIMKHLTVLVIKFVLAAVVTEIILGMYSNLSIREILLVSLAITVITYLIGDLLILYVFNNTVAAVADAGLCWLIIYLSNYMWPGRDVPLLSALSAAVVIGVGEVFLHMYVENNILHHGPDDRDADVIR
ncbi:MAG TPA: DUF2512 family protein [Syntrophomonas sp.]|nr:DUF2512 family protein [Syntrophomonas sp.]